MLEFVGDHGSGKLVTPPLLIARLNERAESDCRQLEPSTAQKFFRVAHPSLSVIINLMSQTRDSVTVFVEDLVQNLCNPTQSKATIFEVDERLRQVNANDYEPQIVSIGPIHHGKKNVKSMEQHKVRYLQQLLGQKYSPSIDKLVEKLRQVEADARKCYPKSLNLDTDRFIGMLLLDSCFIIQLIRNYFFEESIENDPIFKSETLCQIMHDLMLFENQLPFFVLNHLFDMTKREDPDDNICHLVLYLVKDMFPWQDVSELSHTQTHPNHDHLLGLVYQCFSPSLIATPSRTKPRKGETRRAHINSASELKEFGIRLRRSKENSPSFAAGILKLPPLQISGKTESLLRNMMAYEQLRLDDNHPKWVTDCAFFMHCLIRSIKDIEILRRNGIISNYLGGDDKIFRIFDQLGTNFIRSSEFCYSDVFENVNRHCGRRLKKWMAKLWRNYFNSPWSIMKFVAATLLLLFTITQTVFSILAFKYRKT